MDDDERQEIEASAPQEEEDVGAPEEDMGELKIVLHVRGTQALIGVQGKGTDPALEIVPATTLEEALAAVPGIVTRARERWVASPRNPAYQGPPIAPQAPPTARQTPARPASARPTKPEVVRPGMF